MKSAVTIRHVLFEDLGLLSRVLVERGYRVEYRDAGLDDLCAAEVRDADLLVVLGGPIGAYEDAAYPFLTDELKIIEERLRASKPTLGICLGAQLMARALGARVYRGPAKEIGWSPLDLSDAGRASALAGFEEVPVLHWHGDTFDLPQGTTLLASTDLTPNQAFSLESWGLGLQFHGEVEASVLERWLIGHACEIAAAGLDVGALRAASDTHGLRVRRAGTAVFSRWLAELALSQQ